MEIHQIEYFLAVEKFKNFSTAALEINISQSTLSQQIKKLEEALGVKLFVRSARNIRLSLAGEEFLPYAKKIILEVELSREAISKFTCLEKGNIKIGIVPHFVYLNLTRSISHFIQSYPGIDVEVLPAYTDILLKGLREHEINAAFAEAPFPNSFDIKFFPLVNQKLVILASNKHHLASQTQVDLGSLADENIILSKPSSELRNTLLKECLNTQFEPNVILDSAYLEVVKSFVEDRVGIALIGDKVATAISTPETKIIEIKQTIESQLGLAFPNYDRLPLSTKLFKDFILKHPDLKVSAKK